MLLDPCQRGASPRQKNSFHLDLRLRRLKKMERPIYLLAERSDERLKYLGFMIQGKTPIFFRSFSPLKG
jgi:hypothetical protein